MTMLRFERQVQSGAKDLGQVCSLGVERVRGFGLIRNGRTYLIMFNIGLRVSTAKGARDCFS